MYTIYSKNNCPNCVQAKNILEANDVEYIEIKIDEDLEAHSFITSEGHRSVPQVYKGKNLELIGNHLAVLKLSREGNL